MYKSYINESRYKKNVSKKRRTGIKLNDNKVGNSSKNKYKSPKKNKTKTNKNNVFVCIILIILIAIISRAILKEEGESFLPDFFANNENDEIIRLGIITSSNLLEDKGLISLELNKYLYEYLVYINKDYSIKYNILSGVDKISSKEYVLNIDKASKINADEIIKVIKNIGKDSAYYNNIKNIKDIEKIDDKIKVILVENDDYFIYKLDIPIKRTNYILESSSNDKLIYTRDKKANKDLPKKLIIQGYKDMYSAVAGYKNSEIDIFVSNSENVTNILGKFEYNVKKFKNGNSVFLLMSQQSMISSNLELRKAIAYAIDRDSIIKDVIKSKGEKIDLPYIYDTVKYKYDIYASENLLLSNGYYKKDNIYYKKEEGKDIKLSFELIVNENDSQKINIANRIKNNLSSIGININVKKLSETNLNKRLKSGEYDLVLADVTLNNNPDISFIAKQLIKTEQIEKMIGEISYQGINEIHNSITNLQKLMSDNVSIIGIYSDVSLLIYRKNITILDDLSYMNVIEDIFISSNK